jgi:hypothetical protein
MSNMKYWLDPDGKVVSRIPTEQELQAARDAATAKIESDESE